MGVFGSLLICLAKISLRSHGEELATVLEVFFFTCTSIVLACPAVKSYQGIAGTIKPVICNPDSKKTERFLLYTQLNRTKTTYLRFYLISKQHVWGRGNERFHYYVLRNTLCNQPITGTEIIR